MMEKNSINCLIYLLLVTSIGCHFRNESERKKYIGVYKIDWGSAKISGYTIDRIRHENFSLSILANDSFYFSYDMPFIRKQNGKWEMRSIDGFDYGFITYDTSEYGVLNDQIKLKKNGNIYVDNLRTKENGIQLKFAIFKRIY